jgi:ABC-type uncharacterized transport system auxiliary subunit
MGSNKRPGMMLKVTAVLAAATAATLGGCSTSSTVSTASSQASGMSAGDGLMPGQRMSMAAGDKLGLVVYATDRAIARREARERATYASVPTE